MQVNHCSKARLRKAADVLVVPFWQGPKKAVLACNAQGEMHGMEQPLRAGDFLGKEGETLMLYRLKGREKRVLLLGLGKKPSHEADAVRRAYAQALKACKRLQTMNCYLPDSSEADGIAAIEGVMLANYQFIVLKGDTKDIPKPIAKVSFIEGGVFGEASLKKLSAIMAAVHLTRDLVNGNADDITAQSLALLAQGLAKQWPAIRTTVLDGKALEAEAMGLMLAVNQGASREPALILLEYRGDPASKDCTAIVGKGVTYDTGGLNIKPTGSMESMKCDMAGAAAALGVVRAAAQMGLTRNVLVALAIAENAIGPDSYKPGDVIRSHAGKTVEIDNTDAEGRLVLADAFSYVQKKYKPHRLIDMATLTGGIIIALGEGVAGMFSNDDALAKAVYQAGQRVHERVWRMPLYPEYTDMLKSQIADIKNCAGKKASACTAAAFLQAFIKDTPWVHLDIAGTAYLTEAKGYHPTLATGFGVRLLINFLEHLS